MKKSFQYVKIMLPFFCAAVKFCSTNRLFTYLNLLKILLHLKTLWLHFLLIQCLNCTYLKFEFYMKTNTMNIYFSDIPQDLQTIRQFTTSLVIEAASKCLHLITGDTSLPTTLPGSMSARFRLGASLAAACKVISALLSPF